MADDLFEIADATLTLCLVWMNNVRVAGNARDRQIVIAESLTNFDALILGDLTRTEVDVFEVHIQLDCIEIQRPDFFGCFL